MCFTDQLQALAKFVEQQAVGITTKEATGKTLVLPFVQTLGYDIYDQAEVCPKFTAKGGSERNGEVDYAILIDAAPVILLTCRSCDHDLNKANTTKLRRCFHTVSAEIGVLTNGKTYYFYSDLEERKIMDDRPFLQVDLLNLDQQMISALANLTKSSFDPDQVLVEAGERKYIQAIKAMLLEGSTTPSLQMVRFFAEQVYSRHKSPQTLNLFTPIVQKAVSQFVDERVNDRLKSGASGQVVSVIETMSRVGNDPGKTSNHDIYITPEEFEGFFVVNIT